MNSRERRRARRERERKGITEIRTHIYNPEINRQKSEVSNRWFQPTTQKLAKLVLAIATLTGGFALLPRLRVEPYASLNPQQPFFQQFYVENSSTYSLLNVKTSCAVENASLGNHVITFENN